MAVVYAPEVIDYIDDLAYILYQKGYFGFLDSAKEYTDRLTFDIENSIHTKLKKPFPSRFKRYGSYYVTYKPNRRTPGTSFLITRRTDFY